jgi:hypothetical protein
VLKYFWEEGVLILNLERILAFLMSVKSDSKKTGLFFHKKEFLIVKIFQHYGVVLNLSENLK